MKPAKLLGVMAISATLAALAAAPAGAELAAHGDLFVKFSGGIAPKALPRHQPAPISLQIGGVVRTLSGERPPALRRISIAINRGGRFDTEGLPICRRQEIDPGSSDQALAACGPALVGGGFYSSNLAFPEQSSFPARGRILAFNSIVDGRRAILAHIYSPAPLPISRIVVFHIRRTPGTYGTVLSAVLPAATNRYGYLTSIQLDIRRSFSYRGRRRNYLSAACAAPPGFRLATFPFAHASMGFADGRDLSATLVRSCRVRGA
jgi:hypothetical protein